MPPSLSLSHFLPFFKSASLTSLSLSLARSPTPKGTICIPNIYHLFLTSFYLSLSTIRAFTFSPLLKFLILFSFSVMIKTKPSWASANPWDPFSQTSWHVDVILLHCWWWTVQAFAVEKWLILGSFATIAFLTRGSTLGTHVGLQAEHYIPSWPERYKRVMLNKTYFTEIQGHWKS